MDERATQEVKASLTQMSIEQLVHFIGGILDGRVEPDMYWLYDCGCFYGYVAWDKDLSQDEISKRARASAEAYSGNRFTYSPVEKALMCEVAVGDTPGTNDLLYGLLNMAQEEVARRHAE